MNYPKEERLKWAVKAYWGLFKSAVPRLFLKYLDYIDKYGKIKKAERQGFLKILEGQKEEGAMIREWLMEKGKEEGQKEGEKNRSFEVARNMLLEGLDLALISKCTGISQSDLRKMMPKQA